eukprot:CAMPEP_0113623976 /NCGR_PEP_ID=MMETSP0017_2-20120614/12353_1 /TAXON_ID=2856 /ORGANISM="Cylindrotheca closterium" /LENGTH=1072 /DNA_ID=CAMNT_0000533979 /DNA_START=61 /DNA_END=3276 /DNA_ORIENTATION=- /assembly_acc=CAM_ASM_000147
MPFLIPAVVAAFCDFFNIYLNQFEAPETIVDIDTSPSCRLVYLTAYIFPCAVIRLFLLLVPLPYHSYHGTALRCPGLFKAFYGCILVLLFIHIFMLSMCDPKSLSSLLPSKSKLQEHELTSRHVWSLLLVSIAANLCHILLFLHVRSTAPANADFFQGRPKVLFYYASQREDTERDFLLGQNGSNGAHDSSSTSMQQLKHSLVVEVQSHLQRAKVEWTKRINDYHIRSEGTLNQDYLHRQVVPFRVMLQLFAYEDVLSDGKLNAVYDKDDGVSLLFFVPQLMSFLLHGAYESSSNLEEWILATCKRNVYFAHRCYWFLRAWSLESKHTTPSRLSHSSSLTSFENLEESSNPDSSNKNVAKFLPEERAVIEDLLRKVMTAGEKPARALHLGIGMDMDEDDIDTIDLGTPSPNTAMAAGSIPVDPNTGELSSGHWEAVAATRKYGFMPYDQTLKASHAMSNHSANQKSCFDATPVFLDALLTIADNLFRVPREHRTDEFRRQLGLLEVEALPSNSIYLPLQDSNHRVWRIVTEESIAISTKERVPCIVCMEVVDYEAKPTKKAEILHTALPDLTHPGTEKELIHRWRFGYRDPHRRDTALRKFAYQMKNSMQKIQLNQMKASMKNRIEKLKDTKTNLQGLLSIQVPRTLDEEEEVRGPPSLHTRDPLRSTDIERGDRKEEPATSVFANPTSRDGSPQSKKATMAIAPTTPEHDKPLVPTMGQWESPQINRVIDMTPISKDAFIPFDLRDASYQQEYPNYIGIKPKIGSIEFSQAADIESGADEEEKDSTSNPKNGGRTPPVVFKENWKDKEERIRRTSAYGSHPGWRLLPILVKANDDLRQEQLASQLIYKISAILAREQVPVWLCPYEIVALTEGGGLIEAIPDTISLSSLKKNDQHFTSLSGFFNSFFEDPDQLADAQANFCESLAAYSIVCFLLQIKDRHNGNILLDNKGHLIHIDFGFFFLSSPGKNTGFEGAPFKLTREFVDVMGGPDSRLFRIFRMLCYRSFIALRRHCMEIILLVEMLKKGNENLPCFRGRPDDAIKELRDRFRLDLNDRACLEYVNALVDESLENW